ncbi:hypothetical protein ACLKA7_000664 [Drosophila subpalustris]
MPDEPHSTVGDESVRIGRPPADEAWWLEHPIPSPARSVTEEGEPVPWIEKTRSPKASPKHTQRRRVDRPDPSATTRSAMGAGLRSGSPRTLSPATRRRCYASGFAVADERNAVGAAERERKSLPSRLLFRSRPRVESSPTRRTTLRRSQGRCARRRQQESELLREMDDLLEGWEPELDEMLGEVAATLEPLIPRGWRVFLRGTILSAPTIQLLQAEVNWLGGEYHRSRFRVVDGEVLYTVTINAAGAVTVTLYTIIDKRSYSRQGKSCPPWVLPARISLLLVVPTNRVVVLCSTCGRWDTGTHPLHRSPAALLHFARNGTYKFLVSSGPGRLSLHPGWKLPYSGLERKEIYPLGSSSLYTKTTHRLNSGCSHE